MKGDSMDLAIWIKAVIVAGALGVAAGAKYFFKMKDDNFVEEFAEQVIDKETGFDVDLSPGSPEDKK